MGKPDEEQDMDPEQLRRLQKIKERDLEQLTRDQMNRFVLDIKIIRTFFLPFLPKNRD